MFSDDDIAEVMAAEIGQIEESQSRLTLPSNNNRLDDAPNRAVRHGVFQRPALTAEPHERKPRCPFKTEDERQCIYTVDRCPGHERKLPERVNELSRYNLPRKVRRAAAINARLEAK